MHIIKIIKVYIITTKRTYMNIKRHILTTNIIKIICLTKYQVRWTWFFASCLQFVVLCSNMMHLQYTAQHESFNNCEHTGIIVATYNPAPIAKSISTVQ